MTSVTSCSARGIHKQLTGAADPSIRQVYTGYVQQTGVEPRHSESTGWASRPVLSAGQASYVPSAGYLTLIAYGLIVTTCPTLLNRKTDASKLVPFVIRIIWVNLFCMFWFSVSLMSLSLLPSIWRISIFTSLEPSVSYTSVSVCAVVWCMCWNYLAVKNSVVMVMCSCVGHISKDQ